MATGSEAKRDGEWPTDHAISPGQYSQLDHTEAPARTAGSFLVPEEAFRIDGNFCPLDPETLQPYLMRPVDIEARVPDDDLITYHHTRFYREDPDLGGGTTRPPERLPLDVLSGLAVRVSMGEYRRRAVHQVGHQRHVKGSWLPKVLGEKAFTTATNCAGIVPRLVNDFSRPPGKELVMVDDDEFARIADPKYVGIERFRTAEPLDRAQRILAYFFFQFAVRDMEEVPDVGPVADEFLNMSVEDEEDAQRKTQLATVILTEALRMSLDPILPGLSELRAKGFVVPGTSDPFTQILSTLSPKPVSHVEPLLTKRLKDLQSAKKKAA